MSDGTQSEQQMSSLVKALNRYGHHDHNCATRDVFVRDLPCVCGFNQVLQAALDGYEIEPVPPTTIPGRRRK